MGYREYILRVTQSGVLCCMVNAKLKGAKMENVSNIIRSIQSEIKGTKVSIQAQVINLMKELQEEFDLTSDLTSLIKNSGLDKDQALDALSEQLGRVTASLPKSAKRGKRGPYRAKRRKKRHSPYRTVIIELLNDHNDGLTTKEITRKLAAMGVKPLSTKPQVIISAATRRLYSQGFVGREKQSNGRGTIYLPKPRHFGPAEAAKAIERRLAPRLAPAEIA